MSLTAQKQESVFQDDLKSRPRSCEFVIGRAYKEIFYKQTHSIIYKNIADAHAAGAFRYANANKLFSLLDRAVMASLDLGAASRLRR